MLDSPIIPVVDLAESIDVTFDEVRTGLRELLKSGKDSIRYQSKIDELIPKVLKRINDIEEKADSIMKDATKVSECVSEIRSNISRGQQYLSELEINLKKQGNYIPYDESILDEIAPDSSSSTLLSNTVLKLTTPLVSVTTSTQTPQEPPRSLQMSSAKYLYERKSARKGQSTDVPDWAMQGSDVAFTPGLFPKGPSVKSLSISASKTEKKHVKAKHLNF